MGFAFHIDAIDVATAAQRVGVLLTDSTSDYFLDTVDGDTVENEALRGADMDEQTEFAIKTIIEELLLNDEFVELTKIDSDTAKDIIDSALSEYMSDNKDTDYQDFDDIKDIMASYCEDYISSDEFEKAKIDQAIFIMSQTSVSEE